MYYNRVQFVYKGNDDIDGNKTMYLFFVCTYSPSINIYIQLRFGLVNTVNTYFWLKIRVVFGRGKFLALNG